MPPMNAKNFGLSPAANDLGLGDMLKTQLDDATEEERRKRTQAGQMAGKSSQTALSPATLGLFGAGGFNA